jgi:hypothetical protein
LLRRVVCNADHLGQQWNVFVIRAGGFSPDHACVFALGLCDEPISRGGSGRGAEVHSLGRDRT